MDANEFRRDREIDPSALDVECVRQADLFFKWAERSIAASTAVDKQKLKMDVLKGRLEMDCRRNPTDFGLIKVTESSIDAAVKSHDDYQEAMDKLYDLRGTSRLLDAAVNAMEQRKRMLEVLITLHGQQYFAGPSVPRNLGEEWKDHQARVEQNVNNSQKNRTRRRGEKTK